MTLARDAERGFRVEGLFELELGAGTAEDARDSLSGGLDRVVAGARFDPQSRLPVLRLPLAA